MTASRIALAPPGGHPSQHPPALHCILLPQARCHSRQTGGLEEEVGMRVPIRFAVLAGVVAIATLAIGACASTSRGADGERSTQATPRDVTVTVFYRERIMVPPNSELTVQVLDVTKSDSASTTVAE